MSAISSGREDLFISSRDEQAKAEEEASAQDKSKVTHDEFLTLLTTQLTHQDPLNPVQDSEYVSQLSQLQALDQQIAMTEAMIGLRFDSQLQGGSALIGKVISGQTDSEEDVEGVVQRVLVKDGTAYLELESLQQVPFNSVYQVTN